MDFKILVTRYKQFGGIRLFWQYTKLGVLPIVMKGFFRCLQKRQSFKTIYPEILSIIEPLLVERFQVSDFKFQVNGLLHEHPKVIWWCWLQGFNNAPKIAKVCHRSLQRNLKDYEIKVIDAENWNKYVELPDYIQTKWKKKQIPPALFSDLLRLQLLIKYGGSWVDSTVLCTDAEHTKEYLDADLFLFQYTPPGTADGISISNWFISAHSNNEVLMTLRNMLFAYWKEYNCTLDYYIFHLFFAMVAKEYPEEVAAMPYGSSQRSITLMHHLGDTFKKDQWDHLVSKVSFHKLAFRLNDAIKDNKANYYNYVLRSQSY